MKALILVVVVALAGGCAHATVNASASTAGGAAPAAGGSVTGGSIGVHAHSHALAALVVAGMFIAAAIDYQGNPPPPALDGGRRINEQDCTRPIDLSAGNLKCR
ncbi:MAG: hypothetical protein ACREUN_01955 [Burkholderiales bacterium]